MTDPWGIVLVPTEAGRALVALERVEQASVLNAQSVSVVGALPPLAWDLGDGWDTGLRVWWDHALVPEGWDRARRVWWSRPRSPRADVAHLLTLGAGAHRAAALAFPSIEDVLALARALEAVGLCRVVLLDFVDGAVRERAT